MLLQQKLAKYDLQEIERRNARNNLDAFLIEQIRKPDGILMNLDPHRTKQLTDLRLWDDGTKEEYENELAAWTAYSINAKNQFDSNPFGNNKYAEVEFDLPKRVSNNTQMRSFQIWHTVGFY